MANLENNPSTISEFASRGDQPLVYIVRKDGSVVNTPIEIVRYNRLSPDGVIFSVTVRISGKEGTYTCWPDLIVTEKKPGT